ncbi:MAG: hypothetical protein IJA09_04935 [Bacteroidales bacterium]|nr:hypothetical protein [Bacteroidales bacterium]
MKTCEECGCPYENSFSICPECGCPNDDFSDSTTMVVQNLTNCPNCGAPITNRVSCEYCESLLPRTEIPRQATPQSQIIINNNTIQEERSSSGAAALGGAILGGIIGGLLDD